jgi:hypothetical protein
MVTDLGRALPRLATLADAELAAEYPTRAGTALVRLAGRLLFFADSQVAWWQRIPPWRFATRAIRLRGHVRASVDRLLAGAFGAHNLATTRRDAVAFAAELEQEHVRLRKARTAPRRAHWALELARASIETRGITADTELLATSEERVLSGAEYDAMLAAKQADAATRTALVAAAADAHRELRVT